MFIWQYMYFRRLIVVFYERNLETRELFLINVPTWNQTVSGPLTLQCQQGGRTSIVFATFARAQINHISVRFFSRRRERRVIIAWQPWEVDAFEEAGRPRPLQGNSNSWRGSICGLLGHFSVSYEWYSPVTQIDRYPLSFLCAGLDLLWMYIVDHSLVL